MSLPFKNLTAKWSKERLARVRKRAKVLIAQELTLRDLRKAQVLTQAQLARTLGVGQEQISRLEKTSDMLLSTLTGYVQAMGGDLKLIAEFPNRPPVALTHLSENRDPKAPKRKVKRAA
jgi:DNA-binding XRE family transcriptional regulator